MPRILIAFDGSAASQNAVERSAALLPTGRCSWREGAAVNP
jgi:hypothetical protein